MKKSIVAFSFLLLSLVAQAQEKWSLRKCIDYAVENNIEIKQQALQVKNAEINLNTSKNSRLPDLNASVGQDLSFGRSKSEASNGYVSKSSTATTFGINTSVPIFTGFKIPNQTKKSELDLQAATEGLSKAKDNISLQVANFYLEVLFKKEILKAYQEQATLSQKQTDRTEILVKSGKVAESQLYDMKAQLAKDELNVTVSQNDLVLSTINLAQALNFKDAYNFDISEPIVGDIIGDNMSSLVPADQVYLRALQIKPQIKEAELNVQSSEKSLKIAKADYYPTLNLTGRYGTSAQHLFGSPNENVFTQFKNFGSENIGLSLNIPIFNRFQTRNRVKQARLDIENQQLVLENVKLVLFKEIQQAYQSAVGAQAKYNASIKSKDAATESYKYAQDRYEVGKSTVFELSDAQTKLFTSKSEQIQAKYDFLFRAKILDFYQGIEVDLK